MNNKALIRTTLVGVLCLVLAGCGSGTQGTGESTTVVRMTGSGSVYQFEPAAIESQNGVVEFLNVSEMPHNVVWRDKTLKASPFIKKDETWSVKLTTPGVYEYVCTLHPGMNGVIEVSPS